jgi:hypothetical protein
MKTTYFPRVQSNRVCRERKPLVLGYDRAKDPEKVVGLSRVTSESTISNGRFRSSLRADLSGELTLLQRLAQSLRSHEAPFELSDWKGVAPTLN